MTTRKDDKEVDQERAEEISRLASPPKNNATSPHQCPMCHFARKIQLKHINAEPFSMSPTGLNNGNGSSAVEEPHTPATSVSQSSSLNAIRASLSALHTRDAAITTRLQTLVSSQAELSRELGRLDLLRAHLGTQVVHTRDISNGMLDSAAATAAHLSSKVKELDLEKKRV
jgi:hypothetical protein